MRNPNPEIVDLIDDLLEQIFVLLPLESLIHLKLVSKHWNSIISDPRFQLKHSQIHNKNRAVGLIFQKFYPRNESTLVETRAVSFDRSSNRLPPQIMVLPDQPLRIFHSCNGLLVLKKNTDAFEKQEYYVYNPTTNKKTTNLLKDDVKKSRERDRVVGMYLAFDPSKSPHYKVVCVWELNYHKQQYLYQFEVYSSETGSWEIRCGWYNIKTTGYANFENNGVYWNGAIHWFNLRGKSIYFNPDRDEMPRVRIMPATPHTVYHLRDYYFGESCNHLHCAVVVRSCHLARWINVYEMRRDYSEWFLKFRVDDYSQCFLRSNQVVTKIRSVVRSKKDEDENSFLVMVNDEGEMMRYNIAHNTYETIHNKAFDFKRNDYGCYVTNSFEYIEYNCYV